MGWYRIPVYWKLGEDGNILEGKLGSEAGRTIYSSGTSTCLVDTRWSLTWIVPYDGRIDCTDSLTPSWAEVDNIVLINIFTEIIVDRHAVVSPKTGRPLVPFTQSGPVQMSSRTVGQRHHGGTDSDSHRPDSRFPGSRRPLRTSRYAVSPRVWVSSTTVGARHFHHHEAPSSCWSIATPPLAPPTPPPPVCGTVSSVVLC